MSEFFKSKGKLGIALSAVFMLVMLMAVSVAGMNRERLQMPETAVFAVSDAKEDTAPPAVEQQAGEPGGALPVKTVALEPSGLETPPPEEASLPAEVRGAFLVPGVDFLTGNDTSEAALGKEMDKALATAEELGLNTVIVDTNYDGQVIYQTADAPELSSSVDLLDMLVQRAQAGEFAVCVLLDVSLYDSGMHASHLLAAGAHSNSKLASNLTEFVGKYEVDAILLDGYAAESEAASYVDYLNAGGGIGFDNFMRQAPASVVRAASNAIHQANPAVAVGLLADAVWENKSENDEGSDTQAAYTSLGSGNADTKGFIEKGYADFVAVKAYTTIESTTTPFTEVVNWWTAVTEAEQVPVYVVHATDKLFSGESGWSSPDQLIYQVNTVEETSGADGSIFNNLQTLAANTLDIATSLKKLYDGEASADQILTRLEMTKPAQATYTTADPEVTFTGASDPGEPLTINGKEVQRDASGYFTVQYALETGLNTFEVAHKGQAETYTITRELQLLKEVEPTGELIVDGGMTVAVTAVAYGGADVYATAGGQTIQLDIDPHAVVSEADRDSYFLTYTGTFLAPQATETVQELGAITVYASYEGENASLEGASMLVKAEEIVEPPPEEPPPAQEQEETQEEPVVEEVDDTVEETTTEEPSTGETAVAAVQDGVPVQIIAEQALTYPANTLDNVTTVNNYPLPAGALDYAVGDEIVYTKADGTVHKYYLLASGLRVRSSDIQATDTKVGGNIIHGVNASSDSGYTYVTVQTEQPVTYSVSRSSGSISFRFHNTTSVPASSSLGGNTLFASANWDGTTLTLPFSGRFSGYKGYYDGGALVLRFRHLPSSLTGTRIAIDPGHGGSDRGAEGFLSNYPESVINSQLAQAMANELQSRGATVNLMNNAGIEGEQRKQAAEQWGADLFLSVHNNSATNINAAGTEVYYFHSFSQTMASNLSEAVSNALGTKNRGAKQSYYHVTLSPQMPSALLETGFLTNRTEYEKLIHGDVQRQIAVAVADALAATLGGTG